MPEKPKCGGILSNCDVLAGGFAGITLGCAQDGRTWLAVACAFVSGIWVGTVFTRLILNPMPKESIDESNG